MHVSVRETDPPFGDPELSSRNTLKQFHRILQLTMGWEDSHLHEYIVDGQRYGTPDFQFDEAGEVVAKNRAFVSKGPCRSPAGSESDTLSRRTDVPSEGKSLNQRTLTHST